MTVELDWHVDWGVGLSRWERHDARNRVVVVVIRATHRRIERRKKWVWFSRTQCGVGDRHCAECATSSLAFNDYRHNCNTLTASTSVSSDLKALYKSVIIIIIIIIIIRIWGPDWILYWRANYLQCWSNTSVKDYTVLTLTSNLWDT